MISQPRSVFHFNPAIVAAIVFGVVEFVALQVAHWRRRPALTAIGTNGATQTVTARKQD